MTTVRIDHLYRSQFGEDRILWQVFRQRTSGYFIEVGAYDGLTLSNTYFLEQMGWSGLLIEPILPLCQKAITVRPRSRVVHAAVGSRDCRGTARFTITKNVPVLSFLHADQDHIDRCLREGAELIETEVPLLPLDDIILDARRACGGRHAPGPAGSPWVARQGWRIDLISIDVEGMELEVLDGLSLERFKPRILVLENDRAAGDAIEPYLRQRGYRKFHRRKINDFYARLDDPADDLTLSGFELPPD